MKWSSTTRNTDGLAQTDTSKRVPNSPRPLRKRDSTTVSQASLLEKKSMTILWTPKNSNQTQRWSHRYILESGLKTGLCTQTGYCWESITSRSFFSFEFLDDYMISWWLDKKLLRKQFLRNSLACLVVASDQYVSFKIVELLFVFCSTGSRETFPVHCNLFKVCLKFIIWYFESSLQYSEQCDNWC